MTRPTFMLFGYAAPRDRSSRSSRWTPGRTQCYPPDLPDTMRGSRSRLWSNLALVVFGLVVGVLVLAGVLRLAALVVEQRNAAAPRETTESALPILALGDSNTFGLYVGKQRAYPHEREKRWNEAAPARTIRVVNAGYPGNSSSSVRRQLGTLLAAHRPAIVTVMIGGNDWWREPEPLEEDAVDACVRRAMAPPDASPPQPHREGHAWIGEILASQLEIQPPGTP